MNRLSHPAGLVLGMAMLCVLAMGCGFAHREVSPTAVSGTYVLSMYPYDEQVAEAIKEYSTVPLEIVDTRDFSGQNFLGRVRWSAEASRALGRPYVYREEEAEAPRNNNRTYLSSLFSGFSGVDVNQIFRIESTMQFGDFRTYELPEVRTYDDQETVDIFCRMVAKAAQWTSEGERRAILALNNSVSMRALEELQNRVERVEATARN